MLASLMTALIDSLARVLKNGIDFHVILTEICLNLRVSRSALYVLKASRRCPRNIPRIPKDPSRRHILPGYGRSAFGYALSTKLLDRWASLSDIQAVLRHVPRDARHICWLPGKNVQVLSEQSPEIIAHSIGMTLLLRIVTVPPFIGNFNIPCAWMFIHVEVECSSSPILTSNDIWPISQMVSPLNPMNDVVAGIIL
ncbi:hypothetical protein Tco_0565455 [Tanacetum coccineum]